MNLDHLTAPGDRAYAELAIERGLPLPDSYLPENYGKPLPAIRKFRVSEIIERVVAYIERQTDVEADLIEALAEFDIEISDSEAFGLLQDQGQRRAFDNGDPRVSPADKDAAEVALDAEVHRIAARAELTAATV